MKDSLQTTESAFHWSISKFATATKKSNRTVSAKIAESGLKSVGKRGGYDVYAVHEVLPLLYANEVVAGYDDASLLKPKDKLDHFKALNEQQKYEVSKGTLIPQHEVEIEYSNIMKKIAGTLKSIPDVVERDCGVEAHVIAKVENVIDGVLVAMHGEMSEESIDEDVA